LNLNSSFVASPFIPSSPLCSIAGPQNGRVSLAGKLTLRFPLCSSCAALPFPDAPMQRLLQ
jgi:hypothetical protein